MGRHLMIKRVLLLIGLFLPALLPAHAQDATWVAWLYNSADGRMTQVDSTGAVLDNIVLPMPAGFDRYPQKVAVGHGGTPFAYVVFNSSTFQGALVITEGAQLLSSYNLPLTFADSTEFVADETIYNEDNSALALGYSLEGGGWGVLVYDVGAGTVMASIRHDDPLVTVLGLDAGFGLTPVPRRFAGRQVTFTMVQAGTEGAAEYNSYNWNIDTGALTQNVMYPGLDSDTFPPTGEVVMSLPDDRLPNDNAAFTFFQSNSLHIYEPISGSRFPFYNAPNASLSAPQFIQNGELVLFDSADVADQFAWGVVGRDGILVGTLPPAVSLIDTEGVGDGFLYTTDTFSIDSLTLVYVNTRDGLDGGTTVWTSPPGARPIIAWAGDTLIRAQAVYEPWAQLAPPVYAPGADVQIAPAPDAVSPADVTAPPPAFSRFLTIGGLATVNTTDGDKLNVRFSPGTEYQIVTRLEDGERVTLLAGPQSADGFTWWKIRTAAGIEGWVVESVQDGNIRLQTLIPG
jgi:hypothetical protein